MSDARPWSPDDRTGGPLDDLLERLRERLPGLDVVRRAGTHPDDDDTVYRLRLAGPEVQVDTGEGGRLPFSIEHDDSTSMLVARDVESAARHIAAVLSPTVTTAELARLTRLSRACDPGPWVAMVEGRDMTSGSCFIMTGVPGDRGEDIYVTRDSGPADESYLDLIAAARTYLPLLVAQVERLTSS